jgi:hypothetical protein
MIDMLLQAEKKHIDKMKKYEKFIYLNVLSMTSSYERHQQFSWAAFVNNLGMANLIGLWSMLIAIYSESYL